MSEQIYWMPEFEERLTPNREAFEKLTTIKIPKSQTAMDREIYLAFLSEKVQALLNQEPNPLKASRELYQTLEELNLEAPILSGDSRMMGMYLIAGNSALWEFLKQNGLEMPKQITQAINFKAAKTFKEVETIHDWTDALLSLALTEALV